MRPSLIGPLLAVCVAGRIMAQEADNIFTVFKDRALVLEIVARIIEREDKEVWNSVSSKITIPGRSVSLKLVGVNVVVSAQFTPYKRQDGRIVLVAQGQVWTSSKENVMQYQSTMQTIPVDLGELIYFFPLGQMTSDGNPRIEIQIELNAYKTESSSAAGKDAIDAAGTAATAEKNGAEKLNGDKPVEQKTD